MKLTLYGKAGCCLCEEARVAVTEVREQIPFDLEEVDGEEAFELGVDASALRNLLDTVQL